MIRQGEVAQHMQRSPIVYPCLDELEQAESGIAAKGLPLATVSDITHKVSDYLRSDEPDSRDEHL